jgi:hypothetical protein
MTLLSGVLGAGGRLSSSLEETPVLTLTLRRSLARIVGPVPEDAVMVIADFTADEWLREGGHPELATFVRSITHLRFYALPPFVSGRKSPEPADEVTVQAVGRMLVPTNVFQRRDRGTRKYFRPFESVTTVSLKEIQKGISTSFLSMSVYPNYGVAADEFTGGVGDEGNAPAFSQDFPIYCDVHLKPETQAQLAVWVDMLLTRGLIKGR